MLMRLSRHQAIGAIIILAVIVAFVLVRHSLTIP
jgi:hypothetical protein